MSRTLVSACILAAPLLLCTPAAQSQEVVHAVSGTVKSINSAAKQIDIDVEGGTSGDFTIPSGKLPSLEFDSDLRADATDPSHFQKTGDYVVVFYYGFGDTRTAVGLKDLGNSGVQKILGTVAGFNEHNREISVLGSNGTTQTFHLSDTAVVDTGNGLISGRKYHPHKGSEVRVTSTNTGDQKVAVFVWSRSS